MAVLSRQPAQALLLAGPCQLYRCRIYVRWRELVVDSCSGQNADCAPSVSLMSHRAMSGYLIINTTAGINQIPWRPLERPVAHDDKPTLRLAIRV